MKKKDNKSSTFQNIWSVSECKEKLQKLIGKLKLMNVEQTQDLLNLITNHHEAFCLDSQERGKTDLSEMQIHTGEETPRKVTTHRMPLAVCLEVAKQLHSVQEAGVTEPSNSPWSSPVVMV